MIRVLLALALALTGASTASADTYPSKPIRLIVPFTPGGSTDILGRLIGHKLSERFGQQVFVDNRPGAGGSVGAELAARAAPDGYTLLMGHLGTLAVNPGLYPKLGYDSRTSFQPVALIAVTASILTVHPSMPVHDAAALLALARQKPNGLTFGTAGNGSAAHIGTAALMEAAGIQMVHVPYRGTGPMINDLLAGQLNLSLTGAPVVLQHVRAGTLRALAVSSVQRIAAAPELPTLAESALPGFEATQWYGFVAPAGLPADITALLNQAVNQTLGQPDVIERLKDDGAYPQPETPAAFGQLISAEIDRWAAVIKRTGMKAD